MGATLGSFQLTSIPMATGVVRESSETVIFPYGMTSASVSKLRPYSQTLNGIMKRATTVEKEVIVTLEQKEKKIKHLVKLWAFL